MTFRNKLAFYFSMVHVNKVHKDETGRGGYDLKQQPAQLAHFFCLYLHSPSPADSRAPDRTYLTQKTGLLKHTCWSIDAAWTTASAHDEKEVSESIRVG
jgi:hypothetical protein